MNISVSELRPKLTKVLELVAKGEVVNIEQRGKVIAQIKRVSQEVLTEDVKQGVENFRRSVQQVNERDKKILELLRGVNRSSRK